MSKAYRSAVDWENETYSFFERIKSKAKARRVSEKAASATGRSKAKFEREAARYDKGIRLFGFPVEGEPLVCNIPASKFFAEEPPYAA